MALPPDKLKKLADACSALSARIDAYAGTPGKAKTYPGHGRPDASHPALGKPLTGRPDSDFTKLEHKLEKKPGIKDPAALAAYIGRKELGQKEMTRRSVAGRKDAVDPEHERIQLRQQLKDLQEQVRAIAGEHQAVSAALARPKGTSSK